MDKIDCIIFLNRVPIRCNIITVSLCIRTKLVRILVMISFYHLDCINDVGATQSKHERPNIYKLNSLGNASVILHSLHCGERQWSQQPKRTLDNWNIRGKNKLFFLSLKVKNRRQNNVDKASRDTGQMRFVHWGACYDTNISEHTKHLSEYILLQRYM